MLLAGGALGGRRYLKEATVRAMFAPHVIGESTRGLGWDIASPYSRTLGAFFPMGSVGHTGFTGTAIWMDPPSRVYMILLTNRVHPYGKGDVAELRRRVSAAVGTRFAPARGAAGAPPSAPRAPDRAPAADGARPRRGAHADRARSPRRGRLRAARRAARSGSSPTRPGVDAQGRRGVDLLAARARGCGCGRSSRPSTASPGRSTPTCRTAATRPPGCRSGASTDRRGARRPRCWRASTPSSSTSRTWASATTRT